MMPDQDKPERDFGHCCLGRAWSELCVFFLCRGKGHGFRFKDWSSPRPQSPEAIAEDKRAKAKSPNDCMEGCPACAEIRRAMNLFLRENQNKSATENDWNCATNELRAHYLGVIRCKHEHTHHVGLGYAHCDDCG